MQKSVYSSNLQTINVNNFTILCTEAYGNDEDCKALHGAGAVCRNNTCYCDRSRSFVEGNRCGKCNSVDIFFCLKLQLKIVLELFSSYVFPGLHERHSVTCNTHEDCGIDSDKNGIECGFINDFDQAYRVCKCKMGYLLNPSDSTCGTRRINYKLPL